MALSWTMDKIGPMCRSVEDCAIVFNAIYGSDGRDETVVDAPFAWNPDVPLSSLKIGYIESEFNSTNVGGGGGGRGGGNPEDARRRAEERNKLLKEALDVLRAAGAKLEPMALPEFPTNALSFILSAEAAAAFDDLTRSKEVDLLTEQGAGAWPNTFRTSRFIPAVEYIRAQRARTLLNRQMDALMSKYDVFLSPTGSASLGITNLTGHPAACLKAGFVDGSPQALMITGRLYDEATVLRVALAYERATKWHGMNPPLDENLKKMKTTAAAVGQVGQVGQEGRTGWTDPMGSTGSFLGRPYLTQNDSPGVSVENRSSGIWWARRASSRARTGSSIPSLVSWNVPKCMPMLFGAPRSRCACTASAGFMCTALMNQRGS